MNKYSNMKKVYLFTLISFIITFLFIYIFGKTAPRFYTGFDEYTSRNTLSIVADFIFKFLFLVNFIGIVLCIVYPIKILINKLKRKNQLKD